MILLTVTQRIKISVGPKRSKIKRKGTPLYLRPTSSCLLRYLFYCHLVIYLILSWFWLVMSFLHLIPWPLFPIPKLLSIVLESSLSLHLPCTKQFISIKLRVSAQCYFEVSNTIVLLWRLIIQLSNGSTVFKCYWNMITRVNYR